MQVCWYMRTRTHACVCALGERGGCVWVCVCVCVFVSVRVCTYLKSVHFRNDISCDIVSD